jgi:hypothetical protein
MPKFKVKATLITKRIIVKDIDADDENAATAIVLTRSTDDEWNTLRELKVVTK